MSRLSVLVSRPRRTLAALATVTLTITNSRAAQTVMTSTSDMRPGDPARTGTVDITNSGSLSGVFTLQRGTVVDSDSSNPLSGKLDIVVKDCGDFSGGTPTCDPGDPVKYSGTVAAMSSAVALGTFAAAEKHRYEFSVSVNTSAG